MSVVDGRLDLAFEQLDTAVYLRSEAIHSKEIAKEETCILRLSLETGQVSYINWSVD